MDTDSLAFYGFGLGYFIHAISAFVVTYDVRKSAAASSFQTMAVHGAFHL
jgi:hypothetical protein